MPELWVAIDWSIGLVNMLWAVSGLLLLLTNGRSTGWAYHELRPFYWPAAVAGAAAKFGWHPEPVIGSGIELAVTFGVWLVLRKAGRDDRWKRRARAAGQRVVRSVHRLRVVPAPVGAGA